MVEDDLGGRQPTISYRWAIARSGLNEQLRDAGLLGDWVPPAERIRGGALTVLCAFALFVIPGIAFAKISEHWDQSIHRGPRDVPAIFFNLLGSLALACGVAVALAAVALLPTFVQFVRTGGWPAVRRRVRWATAVTLATLIAGGGLVVWAQYLTTHQRNGGFGWYQLLFVVVGILFATTVFAWTAAAVAITRRLNVESTKLNLLGILAVAVAMCMPIMTAAAAAWWGSMATTAPWFLAGTPVGSSPSPLAANLLAVLIVMTIASCAGLFGVLRVIRSWQQLQRTRNPPRLPHPIHRRQT
jgi:MFS family permease